MNQIVNLDTQLFLFLNGLHVDWLDPVMILFSKTTFWLWFYALFIGLAIWKYKRKSLWIVLGLLILVLLSDQISAHVFKPLFQRLRPCHNPDIMSLVYLPTGRCGGSYGFVSSHAANCFAFAIFMSNILKPFFAKWPYFVTLCWAAAVAYSRVYLGVHFPGDIFCGALLGMLLGWLVSKMFFRFCLPPVHN